MPNQPRTTPSNCDACGKSFLAREKDLRRGYGRLCSRGCSASTSGKSDQGQSLAPASPPAVAAGATQKSRVLDLFVTKGLVTNWDFERIGLAYIARNRVAELRREGYVIAQKGTFTGREWVKNAYRLAGSGANPPTEEFLTSLRKDGWIIDPKERRSTCSVQ